MSLRLFVRFLRIYSAAWLRSFSAGGRAHAPLSLGRLTVLLIGFPLVFALQLLHWLGFLCDDVFFRRYRRISLNGALFITGMPRSGTTFVHRLLAADTHSFTTIATWEAFLAPSVTGKCFLMALARLDSWIGSPVRRLTRLCLLKATRDFEEIHSVGPEAPEEDYLLLLPVGGCFFAALAFPASPEFWRLGHFSRLPVAEQSDLLSFHRRCLKAHLYARGRGRRLLSKNAAFATWLPAQQKLYPEARFLVCIREPLEGLSSQISSIQPAHRAFAADRNGRTARQRFPVLFHEGFRVLAEASRLPKQADRQVILDQADLRGHSAELLRAALRQLRIPMSQHLRKVLRQQHDREQNRPHQSTHHHSATSAELDAVEFAAEVEPLYRELRRRSLRPGK